MRFLSFPIFQREIDDCDAYESLGLAIAAAEFQLSLLRYLDGYAIYEKKTTDGGIITLELVKRIEHEM